MATCFLKLSADQKYILSSIAYKAWVVILVLLFLRECNSSFAEWEWHQNMQGLVSADKYLLFYLQYRGARQAN